MHIFSAESIVSNATYEAPHTSATNCLFPFSHGEQYSQSKLLLPGIGLVAETVRPNQRQLKQTVDVAAYVIAEMISILVHDILLQILTCPVSLIFLCLLKAILQLMGFNLRNFNRKVLQLPTQRRQDAAFDAFVPMRAPSLAQHNISNPAPLHTPWRTHTFAGTRWLSSATRCQSSHPDIPLPLEQLHLASYPVL